MTDNSPRILAIVFGLMLGLAAIALIVSETVAERNKCQMHTVAVIKEVGRRAALIVDDKGAEHMVSSRGIRVGGSVCVRNG